MWIFCGGMYRSGSTLQFQITAELVEKVGVGKRIEWDNFHDFNKLKVKYDNYQGLKVFKIHTCTDDIRMEFEQYGAKGVYIFRDIRDVFVSAMKKNSRTFEKLWKQNFLGQCLDEYQNWMNLPRMLISKYEDVFVDLSLEVKRIAAHLKIDISEEIANKIASDFSLEKQVKRIANLKANHKMTENSFDPVSLLHTNHIISGKSGQWKTNLTKKAIILIESKAKNWLEDNSYGLSNFKIGF